MNTYYYATGADSDEPPRDVSVLGIHQQSGGSTCVSGCRGQVRVRRVLDAKRWHVAHADKLGPGGHGQPEPRGGCRSADRNLGRKLLAHGRDQRLRRSTRKLTTGGPVNWASDFPAPPYPVEPYPIRSQVSCRSFVRDGFVHVAESCENGENGGNSIYQVLPNFTVTDAELANYLGVTLTELPIAVQKKLGFTLVDFHNEFTSFVQELNSLPMGVQIVEKHPSQQDPQCKVTELRHFSPAQGYSAAVWRSWMEPSRSSELDLLPVPYQCDQYQLFNQNSLFAHSPLQTTDPNCWLEVYFSSGRYDFAGGVDGAPVFWFFPFDDRDVPTIHDAPSGGPVQCARSMANGASVVARAIERMKGAQYLPWAAAVAPTSTLCTTPLSRMRANLERDNLGKIRAVWALPAPVRSHRPYLGLRMDASDTARIRPRSRRPGLPSVRHGAKRAPLRFHGYHGRNISRA